MSHSQLTSPNPVSSPKLIVTCGALVDEEVPLVVSAMCGGIAANTARSDSYARTVVARLLHDSVRDKVNLLSRSLCARLSGEVVGFVLAGEHQGGQVLVYAYVKKPYRRIGLGSMLMRSVYPGLGTSTTELVVPYLTPHLTPFLKSLGVSDRWVPSLI